MRLVVQIPCFNEAATVAAVIRSVPRAIAGIDERVEVLVVDDGSRDDTATIARAAGADHVIAHAHNRGLARAFQTGLDAALALGADVIVNTDGDGQYPQQDIPRLVAPVLARRAELVIGDRGVARCPHFSTRKRALHAIGSAVARLVSRTRVADPPSGFRAYSRAAAQALVLETAFSHTLETLVIAGRHGWRVVEIPVAVRGATRPSRLFASDWQYVASSALTLLRLSVRGPRR
jgi:glycosyltransferase involved in cell wall biosynthesis